MSNETNKNEKIISEEQLKEAIEKDHTDLIQRTAYLKEKFKKQMTDGGKNLFIRKIITKGDFWPPF